LQQPRQKPVFNLRKAGEGEDQSQWQNLTLKKKEKVVDVEEEEYEEEEVLDVSLGMATTPPVFVGENCC
jgi:hypothetical protein